MNGMDSPERPVGSVADAPEVLERQNGGPRASPNETDRRLGVGGPGIAPDPHLGYLCLGDPHGDQHRSVRRHHGTARPESGYCRSPGDKTTDLLFSSHVVQNKVEEALPAKAKTIVTPIVNELHGYVYGLALKVFESPSSATCGTCSTGTPTKQSSMSSRVNSRSLQRRSRRAGRSSSISLPPSIR